MAGRRRREKSRRRLLLLSPFVPHLDAAMGGPVVIAGLITALSQHESIALLYVRGDGEPDIDPRVADACELTVEVRRSEGQRRLGKAAAAALSALRGTPGWVAEWRVPEYAARLRALNLEWQPDMVQAEFHLMCQYIPSLGPNRPPTVLNHHEPGAEAIADRRRAGLLRGRIMPALEERAWRQYERSMANQIDAIVAFTERDRAAILRTCPNARVEVISPGARLTESALSATGCGHPQLLFFGNYLHAPNVDAALRLGRDIFPRISGENAEAGLWLVGDRPPPELEQLASDCICVPGRVGDLTPYLDAAVAVIVPLRIGGGMRVKVLETLVAGKALIASRLAVVGLDLVDGEHALLAETDDEFARAALWLLANPAQRAALGRRARGWAQSHLCWEHTAERYAALHEDLLARRGEARK